MLQLIKYMYNNVKSRVRGCNSLSEYFNCVVGLKQGDVMSPILFSLFIEELFWQDDVNCGLSFTDIMFVLMLFVDDMVILGNSSADLQQRLYLLIEYYSKWGRQVNAVKIKFLVFRIRGGLRHDEVWQYNGDVMETVSYCNYLGTVFNYTGSFTLNHETLSGKGLKASNVLLNNLKHLNLTTKTKCQLFMLL